mgnify:CR=1 FL=1
MSYTFKPGSLVTLRERPWVVLPSDDENLLLVKPLGGSDQEITGIYKPLANQSDIPVSYDFKKPDINDLGDFTSAKLLYNAARLSFRNAAGPFRCLGRLSFRPRSYQMVPIIMSLKLDPVRLLIADDVGVGKTIEALLIAKELYERKEINGFSIVCLPHLCEQWQDEIKSKFGMDAVIIRSGTAAALDRKIRNHTNIFKAFPFQIISIDYIKFGEKRQTFINHCPNLVIVDEAHTCAKPAGASNTQQQRFALLHDLIEQKPKINLLMLTATPHSGKPQEFQSLLGFLNPEFSTIDISTSSEGQRKAIAKHFIQRRRGDVVKWLDEETKFPERNSKDIPYQVGTDYVALFNDVLGYARELVSGSGNDGRKQRYNYWDALALLRGVMSSPAAGVSMLQKKAHKKKLDQEDEGQEQNENNEEAETVMDSDNSTDDSLPTSVIGKGEATPESESRRLMNYANRLKDLASIEKDLKAKETIAIIRDWLKQGLNPIIFCRYIPTANYIGDLCKDFFKGKQYSNLIIETISSELNDELRKEKIAIMSKQQKQRLLIATDCLSEGINLQEGFNAIIHYDLPWNPNRLEQREGRIDRFGQECDNVYVARLFGLNSPIDGVVLDVLYKKSDEIRKSIGIRVPLPEDSPTVMNAVMQAVLIRNAQFKQTPQQLALFEHEEITTTKKVVHDLLEMSAEREKASRSIFAQNTIKASEIEDDLKEVDEAIGDVKTVDQFVVQCLRFLGVQVNEHKDGYQIFTTNIPEKICGLLTDKNEILVSFKSPTPSGYKYLGRNHPFVEQLCQIIINEALHGSRFKAARASVVPTDAVKTKTVILQLRIRNVISEQNTRKEIVAEEMWLCGFEGNVADKKLIPFEQAKELLMSVRAVKNIGKEEESYWLSEELNWALSDEEFRAWTDPIAWQRVNKLVDSHSRFRKLIKASNFNPVEPILPTDLLGIYILLPNV